MSKRNEKNIHGILNILKPPGMTSHDVVDCVRKSLGVRRVGHTGVLDPAASGVLVLCVGNATRLADVVSEQEKSYVAEVTFGIVTDSYDGDGKVVARAEPQNLTADRIEQALPGCLGEIQQCPPPQSSVHYQGKKLYEWNRETVMVIPEPRPVHVHAIALRRFIPGRLPRALLEISCGKGTYVRTLAHDLGQTVGSGAYLSFLVRQGISSFCLRDAILLEALLSAPCPESLLQPLLSAVPHLPACSLRDRGVSRIRHGMPVTPEDVFVRPDSSLPHLQELALVNTNGDLVALGEYHQVGRTYFQIQPRKVFSQ